MIRKLLLLMLVLGVGGALAVQELRKRWAAALVIPADGFVLTIEQGDSLRTVVDGLHEAGVVPYPDLVVLHARWTGADQQIKRGEYRLPPGINAEALLALTGEPLEVGSLLFTPRLNAVLAEGQHVELELVLEGAAG